ncbi:MAG: hypothetical protein ACHRXM_33540 [Isosphaerales bacterium]
MGSLRGSVQELYVRRLGKAKWDAHLRTVDELWKQIRGMIDDLALDFNHIRVYQDGLPVCDHEEKIVRELALQGSANHRLLVDLMDRGARLTGTESPQLLIEEYEHNRRILGALGKTSLSATRSPKIREQARQLLDQRDRFIAGRIAETLQSEEQGLIFLGMLHSLEGRLPDDVRLTILRPGDRKPRLSSRPR